MRWFATCTVALLLAGQVLAQDKPPTPPALPTPPLLPGLPGAPGAPGKHADLKELIPPLIEALKDADAEIRTAAAGALASIGREAVTPLLKIFEDKEKDKEIRGNIAFVFGQMGVHGQDALPALTKSLKEDDKDVRRKSAVAIHRIVKEMSEHSGYGGFGGFGGPGYPPVPGPRPLVPPGAGGKLPEPDRVTPPPLPPPPAPPATDKEKKDG